MKILQVNNFHHVRGGSDKVYFDTANLLKSNGHEVIFFSSKSKHNMPCAQEEYFAEPTDYHRCKAAGIKQAVNFIYNKDAEEKLQKLLDDHTPNIAHLHVFQSRLSSSILNVFQRNHIPLVMSVHEYKMICPVYKCMTAQFQVCEQCGGRRWWHCVQKRCNQGSLSRSSLSAIEAEIRSRRYPWDEMIDHFIMVSRFIYDCHLKYFPSLKEKSTVLHNFIVENMNDIACVEGDYILYFGRLSPEKGLRTLVSAANLLPDVQFKLVGNGVEEAVLREMAGDNVSFCGFLQGTALTDVIKNSRLVVLPAEWYENNPISVLEAFSFGKPVIASDIGGLPELIDHGINGWLFSPGNVCELVETIQRALRLAPEVLNALGLAAFASHKKFSDADQYYKDLMNIYEGTIFGYDCTN